ncbi:MAG: ABC transporter permease subunit [Planctomycetaceae bacterium]
MTLRSIAGRLRSRLTLPLFVKELTEASSRRRTYIVRAVYGGLLFLLAVLFARDVLFPAGDAFAVLGGGGKLFLTVMLIQFGGVYLFLPAMTAGAITAEKERNTLGLLFLTKLSPTKIVFEKYLGRVFPMLCLALLSLPLLAVAYGLGGLDGQMLFEGVARLLATILMVGAVGIACSAWCRTTAGAFLTTWAALGVLFPGPLLLAIALGLEPNSGLIRWLGGIGVNWRLWGGPEGIVFAFLGPYSLMLWLDAIEQQFSVTAGFLTRPAWVVLWQTTPLLLATCVALVAARLSLVRRAEAKPKRYVARAFRAIDSKFRDLNDRYAKGIEIIKTHGNLPEFDPIAWRETTKTSLGSFRYLVRLLLLVETPILFIGLIATDGYSSQGSDALGLLAGLLWIGAGLLAAVKGAALFPGERARQSLDVLLTTPLSTRAILRQKLAGVRRLIAVCAIPLLSIFSLIAFMHYCAAEVNYSVAVLHMLVAVSVTLSHLGLAAYLATYVGLRISTQSRAMLTSVGLLVALCLTAPLLKMVWEAGQSPYERFSGWSLLSPFTVMVELSSEKLEPDELAVLLVGNTLLYGGAALALRWACLLSAPKLLGRNENRREAERTAWQKAASIEEPRTAAEVTG